MTTEPELTRAVESLASTYGEAARLLVVAERERVLDEIERALHLDAMELPETAGAAWQRHRVRRALKRIRDGKPRGGAGEPVATGED